jgi:AGZA family xanthine/uracil permease-like MFS transporter
VAGTSADKVGFAALAQVGVVYQGMALLGGGSVLAGMVLGSMAAFIIDHKLKYAAVAAFAGAVFAYIGLIHGAQLGWAVSPLVSLGYAMFGVICLVLDRGQVNAPAAR